MCRDGSSCRILDRMLLVEDIRDAVLESGHQITIQIHRDLDGRMAKALGDHLRLDAAADQHGRVSVAEVVEGRFRHPGPVLLLPLIVNLADQAEDRVRIRFQRVRLAGRADTDTMSGIIGQRVGVRALQECQILLLEFGHHESRHGDRPGGERRLRILLMLFPVRSHGHGLADRDPVPVKIDHLPGETGTFFPAESSI